jgi:hypothetical protein
MWISKAKFDSLLQRVNQLEQDVQRRAPDTFYAPTESDAGGFFYRWMSDADSVSVVEAIRALADHLGVKFVTSRAKPASVVVQKVKAK